MFRVFALAVLALLAPLEGGGVMFVAKQIFLGRSAKAAWQNPYVTDGLVAMWDGEWNAGGGVHDAAAAKWKDLSGNGYDYTIASGSWGSDHYVIGGLRCAYSSAMPHGVQTIEIVLQGSAAGNDNIVWGTDKDAGVCRQTVWVYRDQLGFGYYGKCRGLSGGANSYACTFASGSAGAPDTTFFNGAQYVYSGTQNGFSITQADGMAINPRYGTVTGKIYALSLYSRALTADEIAANYAIDKERFNLP